MGTLIISVAFVSYIMGIIVGRNWSKFTKED